MLFGTRNATNLFLSIVNLVLQIRKIIIFTENGINEGLKVIIR